MLRKDQNKYEFSETMQGKCYSSWKINRLILPMEEYREHAITMVREGRGKVLLKGDREQMWNGKHRRQTLLSYDRMKE